MTSPCVRPVSLCVCVCHIIQEAGDSARKVFRSASHARKTHHACFSPCVLAWTLAVSFWFRTLSCLWNSLPATWRQHRASLTNSQPVGDKIIFKIASKNCLARGHYLWPLPLPVSLSSDTISLSLSEHITPILPLSPLCKATSCWVHGRKWSADTPLPLRIPSRVGTGTLVIMAMGACAIAHSQIPSSNGLMHRPDDLNCHGVLHFRK